MIYVVIVAIIAIVVFIAYNLLKKDDDNKTGTCHR